MFARQGMGQGPRTLALRASQGRVQGEPTGRAIIVIVIEREEKEREMKRDGKRGEIHERRERHEKTETLEEK